MPIAIYTCNIAAGMVLLSAAVQMIYFCLFLAFFSRNKYAHIICNQLQSEQLLYKQYNTQNGRYFIPCCISKKF